MLRKVLGYIIEIVAETMPIKDQLQKTGDLEGKPERMVDFSFCRKAAARADGYELMGFLKTHGENVRTLRRGADNFNVLAQIMCTICQEELATEHMIEYTLLQVLAKVTNHETKRFVIKRLF